MSRSHITHKEAKKIPLTSQDDCSKSQLVLCRLNARKELPVTPPTVHKMSAGTRYPMWGVTPRRLPRSMPPPPGLDGSRIRCSLSRC